MIISRQTTLATLFALILLLLTFPALAQDNTGTPLLGPLNSDPLTERGISPRVLDIALYPLSQGIGVIGMWQNGDFDIFDVSVGGISVVDDIPLIERYGNEVNSTISTVQVRADFWVLPFLNLSVIGGNLKTDSDVTLHFTPLFQALYEAQTGDELPATINSPAGTSGTTIGIGLTTGLKYENLVMSALLTYAQTTTNETNSEINALVFVGMVGYDFGDMGMQILTGIQYLDTYRTIVGQIDLGEGKDPLAFSIDVGIEETMFMAGINKDIGRTGTCRLS
jgi:hypothetical protein